MRCSTGDYGRRNEIDRTMQQRRDLLAEGPDDLDCLRLAVGLLTVFPPSLLADDAFVRKLGNAQHDWAGRSDRRSRRLSATFIATYQDRLSALAELAGPCLVIGFELDIYTFAASSRAREHARLCQKRNTPSRPVLPTLRRCRTRLRSGLRSSTSSAETTPVRRGRHVQLSR